MVQKLSEKERITLLMIRGFGDRIRSYDEVRHLFNDFFNERPPISKSTVERTIRKFEESGTVQDLPKAGRPRSATNAEISENVLLSFIQEPSTSLAKVCHNNDVSKASVQRILHRNNFFPYKMRFVQELNEDDFDRRVEFCETIRRKCDNNRDFLLNVVFSDEATFFVDGKVNSHNCRYWSDENPYAMRENHTQNPQKINVWAGILGLNVIGPFFIDENLDGSKYLSLLQDQIVPSIRQLRSDSNTWFQQDGAPPHYSRIVREYLDSVFPNRWIGRRGEIEWPPRSPDLTPLDFFYWGYLKSLIYATPVESIEHLKSRIMEESTKITPNTLAKVLNSVYERLGHCEVQNGCQFEHLL